MSVTARPTPAGRMGFLDNGISEPFGTPRGMSIHHGQDYYWLAADPEGSKWVLSVGTGTVLNVSWLSVMGGCIAVDYGQVIFRFCHMPKDSALVVAGAQVTASTILGRMGDAGSAAGGQTHLHLDAYRTLTDYYLNNRVDPEPFFTSTAGGGKPIDDEEQIVDSTKYFWKDEGGIVYGIFGATYPGGFEVSTSVGTAEAWGRLFGKDDGSPFGKLSAARWETLKAEAAVMNQRWLAQQRSIHGGGSSTVNLQPVLDAVAGVPQKVNDDAAARRAVWK